jgi:class 3 adenylate cyclase
MFELPSGAVTLLFTGIKGSIRLLQRTGGRYAAVLGEYRRPLGTAVQAHGGREVETRGEAFFVAFTRALAVAPVKSECRSWSSAGSAHPSHRG